MIQVSQLRNVETRIFNNPIELQDAIKQLPVRETVMANIGLMLQNGELKYQLVVVDIDLNQPNIYGYRIQDDFSYPVLMKMPHGVFAQLDRTFLQHLNNIERTKLLQTKTDVYNVFNTFVQIWKDRNTFMAVKDNKDPVTVYLQGPEWRVFNKTTILYPRLLKDETILGVQNGKFVTTTITELCRQNPEFKETGIKLDINPEFITPIEINGDLVFNSHLFYQMRNLRNLNDRMEFTFGPTYVRTDNQVVVKRTMINDVNYLLLTGTIKLWNEQEKEYWLYRTYNYRPETTMTVAQI